MKNKMNNDQKKIPQIPPASSVVSNPIATKPQNQSPAQPVFTPVQPNVNNNANVKTQPQQSMQNASHPPSASSTNFPKGDEVYNAQHPNQTSIALLSRGLKLLSISHLRQLLRDYSLPTGGNKQTLVDRLILFLETFGPTQQALVVQFSVNLKKLLSSESPEANEENASGAINLQNAANSEQPQASTPANQENTANSATDESLMQLLPPGVSDKIFETSPSILFATTDHQLVFGPVMIQAKSLSQVHEFTLINPTQGYIPILQFAPVFLDSPLKSITVQLTHKAPITLNDPMLWCPVSDFINKSGSFQVKSTDPSVPFIAVVRWLKKLPLSEVVQSILAKQDLPVEIPENMNENNSNDAQVNLFSSLSSSGICPITRKIMLYPARGKNCMHKECFDLSGYLSLHSNSNQWNCPFCNKTVYAEDLRFDPNYFSYVMNK